MKRVLMFTAMAILSPALVGANEAAKAAHEAPKIAQPDPAASSSSAGYKSSEGARPTVMKSRNGEGPVSDGRMPDGSVSRGASGSSGASSGAKSGSSIHKFANEAEVHPAAQGHESKTVHGGGATAPSAKATTAKVRLQQEEQAAPSAKADEADKEKEEFLKRFKKK